MSKAARDAMDTIKNAHRAISAYKRLFPLCRTKSNIAPNDVSYMQDMKPFPGGDGFAVCPICSGVPWDPMNDGGGVYDTNWSLPPQPIGDCTGMFQGIDCEGVPTETNIPEATEEIGIIGGTRCPCCNNDLWRTSNASKDWGELSKPGLSPSTADGTWLRDVRTIPGGEMDKVIEKQSKIITEAEKQLPEGGDLIQTVAMSKVETIGSAFNDVASFRTDPIGKLRLDGVFLTAQALIPYYLPCPHTEYVDVADIPGGDYILTVGNKWKVNVGSRGISLQTTGPFDQSGTIFNLNAIEFNIASKNDIIIDGGERLTLRARKITVNPVEHNALTIDGQLHVTRNVLIKGSVYIEGELGIQHLTTPVEWHEVDYPRFESELLCPIDVIIEEEGIPRNARLWLPQHKHSYATIPFTPKNNPNGVRAAMAADKDNGGYEINSRTTIKAADVVHHTGIRTIYADAAKLMETGDNMEKIMNAAQEYIFNNQNLHGHGADTEGTATGDLYYAAMNSGGLENALTYIGAFTLDGKKVELLFMTPIYAQNHLYEGDWEKRYEMIKVTFTVGDEYEISNIQVTPLSAAMARTQNGECMTSDEELMALAAKYPSLGE